MTPHAGMQDAPRQDPRVGNSTKYMPRSDNVGIDLHAYDVNSFDPSNAQVRFQNHPMHGSSKLQI